MKLAHIIKESGHHVSTILFIGGFVFDLFILPEAGHTATIWIGFGYLSMVALSIALREWVVSRNTASPLEMRAFSFLTFSIAYFSGSALSFVCVYTLRSATLSVSWPLLILLFVCVFANEFISSHHFRFTLDVGVLLTALLFFIIFNMPVLLKTQNDVTFLISTGVSILLSLLYLYILQFTSESASEEASRLYALGIGIPMFIGMLYFLNIIPAVPLSLNKGDVYHSVSRREGGAYDAVKETDTRLLSILRTRVYHLSNNDKGVYFFSSVSAPAELTAPISHVWEVYNEGTHRWEEKSTISFTLAGGGDNGYRAYSQKENISEGLWRVTVKVGAKRIVGRVKFYVTKTQDENVLVEERL